VYVKSRQGQNLTAKDDKLNWDKLEGLLYWRVRIRPVAQRFDGDTQLVAEDDVWIVKRVQKKVVVELENVRTGHIAKLGNDYIHHFVSDPPSETDGAKHAILDLDVQIVLRGQALQIEPIRRSQLAKYDEPELKKNELGSGKSTLKAWHESTSADFLVQLQNAKGQKWPVPIERNHCHFSYRIGLPSKMELPQADFLKILQQASLT
jgi:hypothetical protein